MSPIEQAIIKVIKKAGPMKLNELRTHLNSVFQLSEKQKLPLETVKHIALSLCDAKYLDMKTVGHAYLFKYRDVS